MLWPPHLLAPDLGTQAGGGGVVVAGGWSGDWLGGDGGMGGVGVMGGFGVMSWVV